MTIARLRRGNMGREALAYILDCSVPSVRNWELGLSDPSAENLAKIEAWLSPEREAKPRRKAGAK